jgi:hypothetical protein
MSRYDTNACAIPPQSARTGEHEEIARDEGKRKTMEASKATEPRQQDSSRQPTLDDRYGKIGISAVAAAVRHQGELRNLRDDGSYHAD